MGTATPPGVGVRDSSASLMSGQIGLPVSLLAVAAPGSRGSTHSTVGRTLAVRRPSDGIRSAGEERSNGVGTGSTGGVTGRTATGGNTPVGTPGAGAVGG